MLKSCIMAIVSGILMALAWPSSGWAPLLFIGLVPLLSMEDILNISHKKYDKYLIFPFAFIAFFIWNALSVWWLHYSKHPDGSYAWEAYIPPTLLNALLMTFVFQTYNWARNKIGSRMGQIFLVCLWISFEKLHLQWEFAMPWINIGNGMAHYYKWIQWYEYTGTLGGTAWIWIVNLSFFNAAKNYHLKKNKRILYKKLFFNLLKIFLPIGFSYILYISYQEHGGKIQVVVIQPNIDPYREKYKQSESSISKDLIKLSQSKLREDTSFLVAPETAFPYPIYINKLSEVSLIKNFYKFICSMPHLAFVIGAETFTKYSSKKTASESAFFCKEYNSWIDNFNSAIQVDVSGNLLVYHKSKLVPGVEIIPYKKILKPILGNILLNFGGTTKGLGRQAESLVFTHPDEKISIAPVICYESIFGEYVSSYILKGAQLIFILTNDGWWGNSEGHKQHLAYARLRAIENRRSIARSANTGISAFINQRGDIISAFPYGKKGALRENIYANDQVTFYSLHGDFIAHFAIFIAGILFIPICFFNALLKCILRLFMVK